MNKGLTKGLLRLKENDRIKINGKTFTIQERFFYKADPKDEFGHDATRYELGNNYVLEFIDEDPSFFQIIEKTHLFGFTSSKSKVEKIETIEIV